MQACAGRQDDLAEDEDGLWQGIEAPSELARHVGPRAAAYRPRKSARPEPDRAAIHHPGALGRVEAPMRRCSGIGARSRDARPDDTIEDTDPLGFLQRSAKSH